MDKITQIEKALKAINQAKFQNLIIHLLHLQGNKFIGAPGSVVGKEKTRKGVPDSFFMNEDKYIFVECTTQEKVGDSKSFLEKLLKDIDHCFNESETKISNLQIGKIILACNERINVDEHNLLTEKVKSYNSDTIFEILNIQNLPLLLFENPKIVEEYLNIQIIKGDIYKLDEFLLKTQKGMQPSLTNEFIGRENELKNSIEVLKKCDILLLTGGAGVGKSKLAVKILDEFSNEEYIPIVIQNSAVSLLDDYQHLFSSKNKYIVLMDDANKSIFNLTYLLDKLTNPRTFEVKIVITSRDYVKNHVLLELKNYRFEELNITEFKDEEINKIVLSALPGLQYHPSIKRKIIDLSKGNARVALMATYSVTPDSEMNYLENPVLLYEKYFSRISEEIDVFENPIVLKSIAIISFFGVLDKNNENLKSILKVKFDIDWNELWSTIMELHFREVLDVYSDEIVKVSDQVLATYSFYKCFIDDNSAVIDYSEWIDAFVENYSDRIRSSLIDVNNTFEYHYVKKLVLPHLNKVLKNDFDNEKLYSFYKLFWFYKDRDCLVFVKKWIESLPQEEPPEIINFNYTHNDHPYASEYFELLYGYWRHSNELLKISLELTLQLLMKVPSRLSEILKFINESFKYKLSDLEDGYYRQNILLDFLLNNKLVDIQKKYTNGIFLSIAEELLGWHFTEFGSSKGNAFNIYNFDLYKSDELLKLRKRILNQVHILFDPKNIQIQKILHKINHPGGKIDISIYVSELPIYQKIISEKLNVNQYSHCVFVKDLKKHLSKIQETYPNNWNKFINSEIVKLSKFLEIEWEYRDKNFQESELKKRQKFDDFVASNDWETIEKFLLEVNSLFKQQSDVKVWFIEYAIKDIYISIAKKGKKEIEKALRLFFNGDVSFPLRTDIIHFIFTNKIMSGRELIGIINSYKFESQTFWVSTLLAELPDEQINECFLIQLLEIFKISESYIYIPRMIIYKKYIESFDKYKIGNPDLEHHNVITYLSQLILNRPHKFKYDFGFDFCIECAPYFVNHLSLLKEIYWANYEFDSHFDHDGKELEVILSLDNNFINESIKNGTIGFKFSNPIRLEKINTNALWKLDDYEDLIEDIILTAIEKEPFTSIIEDDIYSLFIFDNHHIDKTEKAKTLIVKLTQKHCKNEKIFLILIEVVYHNFRNWFIEYFKGLLQINNDFSFIKKINFGRSESWTGSRVPLIQRKIDFYQQILDMIYTLPNLLDYAEHLDYFEQMINWKKKEIKEEQKKDFKEEFY